MTTLDRTHRIMNTIPDGHKVWPEWYWPYCGICGTDCEKDANKEAFCHTHDAVYVIYKYDPPTEGQGEWALNSLDLADEKNLWALLRVWRHVSQPITVTANLCSAGGIEDVAGNAIPDSLYLIADVELLLCLEPAND